MSGRWRVLWISAASLVSLVILLLITALIAVQTGWFRNFVREKIVSAVEEAMGGKAEIGSFTFEVGRLRANVDNFVRRTGGRRIRRASLTCSLILRKPT